ncbi:MAG TPA: transcription antitermination factor NusB [Actinomycetota bacterium]|nr:transcription antitermination factor NusB [Actinomycetota bacterium]
MASRRDARRLALDILYQADVTGADPASVVGGWLEAGREVPAFSIEIVEGVASRGPEIDALLGQHAQGWSVPRMTALDRAILRIAVYELLHRPDVPPSAAISEAVEAAAELSSEESKSFVNGVLGRIARGSPEDGRVNAG